MSMKFSRAQIALNLVGLSLIFIILQINQYPKSCKKRHVDRDNSILQTSMSEAEMRELRNLDLPTIYIITPTYFRPEQIPELTRLSQCLIHIPSIIWLVIEDSTMLNPRIADFLNRSGIEYVHLFAPMPPLKQFKAFNKGGNRPKGASNRNKGLEWVRKNSEDTRGVIYFADDDNTYDIRLFQEIRSVKTVGMWPVGLVANYLVSSPKVNKTTGLVIGFHDGFPAGRKFQVDMAGFAVSLSWIQKLKKFPKFPLIAGHQEDIFLKQLNIMVKDIQPLADNCTKIYVWHTKAALRPAYKDSKLSRRKYEGTNVIELYGGL